MLRANMHMLYPSSRIPDTCISMNEGKGEAAQGKSESEGIGRVDG